MARDTNLLRVDVQDHKVQRRCGMEHLGGPPALRNIKTEVPADGAGGQGSACPGIHSVAR
jgi:hypothetical protein